MTKKTVGIVGWRGMVGSVLIERMKEEDDFKDITAVAFTTSSPGKAAPEWSDEELLLDAHDISALSKMDYVVSCQGGDYTKQVHPSLRASSWQGYWIDAASALRMNDSSVIVLDPINKKQMLDHYASGGKDFVGGNCTVSLMLLATYGLIKNDLIDWVSAMTYQAATGSGARYAREMVEQMGHISSVLDNVPASEGLLALDRAVSNVMHDNSFPVEQSITPLAGSVLPFIDSELENGQSREEWKAMVEANKILGLAPKSIKVDGTCVRVGAMRCHSQALTIKLKKSVSLDEVESMLKESHEWLHFVANNKADTLNQLTPHYVSGTNKVAVGRVRPMELGNEFLNMFTVGDQLLWGAAEPIRRTLAILINQ
jgi:aspartate-semialdehyde dehydrogenase